VLGSAERSLASASPARFISRFARKVVSNAPVACICLHDGRDGCSCCWSRCAAWPRWPAWWRRRWWSPGRGDGPPSRAGPAAADAGTPANATAATDAGTATDAATPTDAGTSADATAATDAAARWGWNAEYVAAVPRECGWAAPVATAAEAWHGGGPSGHGLDAAGGHARTQCRWARTRCRWAESTKRTSGCRGWNDPPRPAAGRWPRRSPAAGRTESSRWPGNRCRESSWWWLCE